MASAGTPGDPIYNGFTWDAGVTVIPTQGLHIAAVGRNLTPNGSTFAPLSIVGAAGSTAGGFTVEADANADFTTYAETRGRYMLGGEYLIIDRVPVRLGYRYDDGTKTHAISGGVGYVDRKWSVELGIRRDVVSDRPATLGVIGVRFFYDQTGSDEMSDPGL